MTKPTFEQCLAHIETELGFPLLDWHKEYLKLLYQYPNVYIIPARCNGRVAAIKAEKLLKEFLKEKEITKDEIFEQFND